MLTRLLDLLKSKGITVLCTSLTGAGDSEQQSEAGISSLMDTWLLVRNLESGGERNRGLYILKSRGMAHSNQVRDFVLCDQGVKLIEPYVGMGTVLTGSARAAQEARERAAAEENNDRERSVLEASQEPKQRPHLGCQRGLGTE